MQDHPQGELTQAPAESPDQPRRRRRADARREPPAEPAPIVDASASPAEAPLIDPPEALPEQIEPPEAIPERVEAPETAAEIAEAADSADAPAVSGEGSARAAKRWDKERRRNRALVFLMDFALLLAALAVVGVIFMNTYMHNDVFMETHYVVQSSKIHDRVRTVVITDLHLKEYGKDNAVLLERVAALKPDFISVVGDMFTYGENLYEPVYELCRKLVEIAPVYYSMGNHELSEILNNKAPIKERLKDTGVTLLHNTTVEVTVNGNALVLGGLSQKGEGIQKYAPDFMEDFLSRDGFRLLLTHFPSNFIGYLENEDIDLALCGHEHGGVIRLPIVGAIYTADQGFLPELTDGLHHVGENDVTVIISRGLGDSSPIPRINTEPELLIIDLCDDRLAFDYW